VLTTHDPAVRRYMRDTLVLLTSLRLTEPSITPRQARRITRLLRQARALAKEWRKGPHDDRRR
jgi:hypothetical protein